MWNCKNAFNGYYHELVVFVPLHKNFVSIIKVLIYWWVRNKNETHLDFVETTANLGLNFVLLMRNSLQKYSICNKEQSTRKGTIIMLLK